MTYRRFSYLLLSIISALLCVLVISHAVRAESDWQFMGSTYGTASFAGTMGYDDPGLGTQVEASARWKSLEIYGTGRIAYQHKQDASSGYTWGWAVQPRGYVWQGLYLHGDIKQGGYCSEFETGTKWRKSSTNWGGGIGYNFDVADLWLTIYNKETGSPNDIWTSAFNARFQIWKWIWGLGSINYSTWDQVYPDGVHRLSGITSKIGIGVRW